MAFDVIVGSEVKATVIAMWVDFFGRDVAALSVPQPVFLRFEAAADATAFTHIMQRLEHYTPAKETRHTTNVTAGMLDLSVAYDFVGDLVRTSDHPSKLVCYLMEFQWVGLDTLRALPLGKTTCPLAVCEVCPGSGRKQANRCARN